MEIVDASPDGSIQKFYSISPAHYNLSTIEAWFSTVRAGNQDSAVQYDTMVGGKEMIRWETALRNNSMYSSNDVEDIQKETILVRANELSTTRAETKRCKTSSVDSKIRRSMLSRIQHKPIQKHLFRQYCLTVREMLYFNYHPRHCREDIFKSCLNRVLPAEYTHIIGYSYQIFL